MTPRNQRICQGVEASLVLILPVQRQGLEARATSRFSTSVLKLPVQRQGPSSQIMKRASSRWSMQCWTTSTLYPQSLWPSLERLLQGMSRKSGSCEMRIGSSVAWWIPSSSQVQASARRRAHAKVWSSSFLQTRCLAPDLQMFPRGMLYANPRLGPSRSGCPAPLQRFQSFSLGLSKLRFRQQCFQEPRQGLCLRPCLCHRLSWLCVRSSPPRPVHHIHRAPQVPAPQVPAQRGISHSQRLAAAAVWARRSARTFCPRGGQRLMSVWGHSC